MNSTNATINPLLQREIGKIRDWDHWEELWGKASTDDELLGLLHAGLGKFHESAVVCFYLEIADGYRYESNFRKKEDSPYDSQEYSERRRKVAEKAWKMLCLKFFKNTNRDREKPSWFDDITNAALFEKLFWFFDGDRRNRPSSLGEDHNRDICNDFLLGFVDEIWNPTRRLEDRWQPDAIAMFKSAQPRTVKLLDDYFGTPKYLLSLSIENIGEETMKVLEELAFSPRHSREERYVSLDAACFDHKEAAGVLLLLQAKKREWERQKKIREAKQQKEEAEQRLAKLQK